MTLKQRLFIKKYLTYNGNATLAVMEVYNVRNRNSAAVIGSRLLRNVKVRQEISIRLESGESSAVYMVALLKNVLENGSDAEKIKALQIAYKLHGF